jgi:hypothetical protein
MAQNRADRGESKLDNASYTSSRDLEIKMTNGAADSNPNCIISTIAQMAQAKSSLGSLEAYSDMK